MQSDNVKGRWTARLKALEMPDAYLIIFLVIAVAAVATHFIPAGSFSLQEVRVGEGATASVRQVIDPDSFSFEQDADGEALHQSVSLFSGEAEMGRTRIHHIPANARGEIGLFNYAFEGLTSGSKYGAAVGVVAFILVIGGAFGIILRTGAVDAGILRVIRLTRGRDLFLIPVLFFLFSLGGAVFGMSEEAIAFAMLVTPLLVRLGYDSILAVLVTYGATQIGFATSWMNPFNIGVAQGLAGVPVLSGASFRVVLWLVFTGASVVFVIVYALRIRNHPERSLSRSGDLAAWPAADAADEPSAGAFRIGHALVLLAVLLGVVWVIQGVVVHQYYIPEIATQFFIMGVVAGLIGVVCRLDGMRLNDLPRSFRQGAADLLGAALIVGMAKGIVLVLGGDDPTTPSVLNTLLHFAGQWIAPLSEQVSALGMLVFQSLLNFLIPSGSGQAALTMPLMAPLADLAGVSRQVAVLAFQLGDGLTNLIVPTSAALMGTLAVARLDFVTWIRFIWRVQIVLFLGAAAAVVIAVAIHLQ